MKYIFLLMLLIVIHDTWNILEYNAAYCSGFLF